MSMTDKELVLQVLQDYELVLQVLQDYSRDKAVALQADQVNMTGTELYAQEQYIPDFQAARATQNMITRNAGRENGFVCRSTAGRVVRLLQNYDSDERPGEPETLPAQWGFVWSTDPRKALPFVALADSPYNTNDCCIYPAEDGVDHVYRSGQDGNVWPPRTVNIQWDDLGTVEEVMGNV